MSLPEHPYSRTEATRLLCAGTYQDAAFRRHVIDELVTHRERPVAPPLGVDVLPSWPTPYGSPGRSRVPPR